MKVFEVRNVNQALPLGVKYLYERGMHEDSRNGQVLAAPSPVTTAYSHPRERVLFSPVRNANPFFHLMEALWIMAGQNTAAWPALYNQRLMEYSDDGLTLRGSAYGYRWRHWFGHDQLVEVSAELALHHQSRRAVLTMWDPRTDLQTMHSRDLPCNTHIYFDRRGDRLNMTVCNRSNDVWWGAYGANAVHFSILQEWLAAVLAVPVGVYYQVSNNYHLYTSVVTPAIAHELCAERYQDQYTMFDVAPYPLVAEGEDPWQWMVDANLFVSNPWIFDKSTAGCRFFSAVAYPVWRAWKERKEKKNNGLGVLADCAAEDWRTVCTEWIQRHKKGEFE